MLPCANPAIVRLSQVLAEYLPEASVVIDPHNMITKIPSRSANKSNPTHENRSRNRCRARAIEAKTRTPELFKSEPGEYISPGSLLYYTAGGCFLRKSTPH